MAVAEKIETLELLSSGVARAVDGCSSAGNQRLLK
jgi:hypothetical protein